MKIPLELNIGLEVSGGINNPDTCNTRAATAIRWLAGSLVHSQRFETTYTGPDGEVRERGLFVRLETNNWLSAIGRVYTLSQMLGQDCIAVYHPSRNSGLLVGPRESNWPTFDLQHFTRINAPEERIAA